MSKDYNIDLIISSGDFEKNRLNMIRNTKPKLRLKSWVKNTLWFILGGIVSIIVYQMFTIKTTYSTPVGDYECQGGIIKICHSSKEVADYLGV